MAKPFGCTQCSKSFTTRHGLDSHCAAKGHAKLAPDAKVSCRVCTKTFAKVDHLQQHAADTGHDDALGYDTTGSESGIHVDFDGLVITVTPDESTAAGSDAAQASPAVVRQETPLDRFFQSFPGFEYDPTLNPAISFAQLKKHLSKIKTMKHEEMQYLPSRFHIALDDELELHFGAQNLLGAWQKLCAVVPGVTAGESVTICKKTLANVHVNILDIVAFARQQQQTPSAVAIDNDSSHAAGSDTSRQYVRTFATVKALKKYSKSQGKVFPLAGGARLNGDRSAALKAFLRPFRLH